MVQALTFVLKWVDIVYYFILFSKSTVDQLIRAKLIVFGYDTKEHESPTKKIVLVLYIYLLIK